MEKSFLEVEIQLLQKMGYTVRQESLNGYIDFAFKDEGNIQRLISRSPHGFLAKIDSDEDHFDDLQQLQQYFNSIGDACLFIEQVLTKH